MLQAVSDVILARLSFTTEEQHQDRVAGHGGGDGGGAAALGLLFTLHSSPPPVQEDTELKLCTVYCSQQLNNNHIYHTGTTMTNTCEYNRVNKLSDQSLGK